MNAIVPIDDPTAVVISAETAAIAADALAHQIEALETTGIFVTQRHPWRGALRQLRSRLEEVIPR